MSGRRNSNTDAPDFDPYSPEFAADPYPVYTKLRETSPVFRSDALGMTCLTRHRDVFRALTDRRLARAFKGMTEARATGEWPYYDRYVRVNLLETEGETHTRLRRLLGAALTPKRVNDLAARVQAVANDLLDGIEAGSEVDFIAAIAEPLPVTVISELLGWPTEERHRLRPWSADIVRPYEKNASRTDFERAETACREFARMLGDLAALRYRKPEADLISALAALRDEPDGLSADELIANCMLLLNAGHEATVNAAGNGLLALLRHPEALQRLRAQPEWLDSAIEEMLRYDAPLHLFHRFALEDMTIAGRAVRQGEMIGLLYGSANRDPEVFPDADRFDIGRSPNRHLGFGAATHFCLGAPLARLELRTLFRTLLQRMREIERVDEKPEYRTGLVFRGLRRLRIRCRS
ncbi:MAG: cytochrome P450 [Woeseiaceae bacterium]